MAMKLDMRERGERYIPPPKEFDLTLRQMLGRTSSFIKKQRDFPKPTGFEPERDDTDSDPMRDWPHEARRINTTQQAILNFPDLTAARRAFEVYMKQPIEWTDPQVENSDPLPPRGKTKTYPKY